MTKSPGMSFSLQETELDLTYKSRYRFVQCYCSTNFTFWKEPFGIFLFFSSTTLDQGCPPSWSVRASHPWRLCRLPDALCQVVYQLNTVVGGFSDIWMGKCCRSDELAEAWRIFTPLLHAIDNEKPQPIKWVQLWSTSLRVHLQESISRAHPSS